MIRISMQAARSSITSSKVRSILTTFGVIIGVIFFVLISSVVDGLNAGVTNEVNNLGGNLISVLPGDSITRDEEGNVAGFDLVASLGASTLTEKDFNDISEIDGVNAVSPIMLVSGKVSRGDMELKDSTVIATNDQYAVTLNQNMETGNFFDADSDKKVVVVGRGVVDELFAGSASLGSRIKIRSDDYTIVGIVEKFDQSGISTIGPDVNSAVFIPLEVGKKFSDGNAIFNRINIQLNEDADINQTTNEINEKLKSNHGDEQDFSVARQDEILDITDSLFNVVKNFSNIISIIILVIGGVVILLVLLITVNERTKEIGLRKALGATSKDILVQFLFEAVAITWFGVFLGSVLAVLISFGIRLTTSLTPVFTFNTFLVALLFSTFFGVVGGLIPAFIASRKDPINSLRNE